MHLGDKLERWRLELKSAVSPLDIRFRSYTDSRLAAEWFAAMPDILDMDGTRLVPWMTADAPRAGDFKNNRVLAEGFRAHMAERFPQWGCRSRRLIREPA